MSCAVAVFIVVASSAAAAFASQLLRRAAPVAYRRRHHETGSAFFLQLGVLLSVLLAFVFSEVWGEYNTASQAINGECGALHGATILASTLPAAQAHAAERAILAYTDAVAHAEWTAMADRHSSPEAVQKLTEMLQTAASLPSANAGELANREAVLALLTTAHAQRETRIFQMTQALPGAVWLVLSLYTLVLVACVLMAGVESAAWHAMFAGAFTGCIVMVLVLVRMLDYPFEGALALGNGDFLKVGREIAGIIG